MTSFADRLITATRTLGHPLCVGLDPFPDRIPERFGPHGSLQAVEAFCLAMLDRVAGKVALVKPQIGLFEPWGGAGYDLVGRLGREARKRGLLVLLDAKRGDIGTTADGYAKAAFGPAPGLEADCVTVNPYLGLETLTPFADAALASDGGVAVLVRTSNPGARDFQDLLVDGAPLWTRIAAALAPLQDRMAGDLGWSSLMVVAGATWPDEARRLRTILPSTLFLVPGYGAQGGAASDAVAGFVPGPNGLEGGVVSSSRAVLYPGDAQAAATAAAWEQAIDQALDAATDDLQRAVSSDSDAGRG
ncbi:MAG: orotidine-5'-phosphate decarboxylase [Hyphomonadaceae bacterium]|jgi:orotidine-5'-phosphate decarboxylase|nr:orotidine-5'-phosphate decarboxylase [Hyphomonadaceae bacterium]